MVSELLGKRYVKDTKPQHVQDELIRKAALKRERILARNRKVNKNEL